MCANRVVVCSPKFMAYGEEVAASFKKLGFSVELLEYSLRSPNLYKTGFLVFDYVFFMISWCCTFLERRRNTRSLLKKAESEEIDYVCIIHGGFFIPATVKRWSDKSETRFFVWLMDPLKKFPYLKAYSNSKKIILASYDEYDCREHNLTFLPLFCDEFRVKMKPKVFDLAFIGSIDQKRLSVMNDIINENPKYSVYLGGVYPKISLSRLCVYLFPGRYHLWKKSFVNRVHSREEIEEIYASANCIINVNADRHTGASMRFFEALRARKAQMLDVSVANTHYVRALTLIGDEKQSANAVVVRPRRNEFNISVADRLQRIIKVLARTCDK